MRISKPIICAVLLMITFVLLSPFLTLFAATCQTDAVTCDSANRVTSTISIVEIDVANHCNQTKSDQCCSSDCGIIEHETPHCNDVYCSDVCCDFSHVENTRCFYACQIKSNIKPIYEEPLHFEDLVFALFKPPQI